MSFNAQFDSGDPIMVDYTPGSAVSAGDVVVQSEVPMVAHEDIASDALGALAAMGGIYKMTADAAIAIGTRVYWNASSNKVTTTASGHKLFGFVVADPSSQDGDIVSVLHVPQPVNALPTSVSFSPAAGSSNVCLVTMHVKDQDGNNLAAVVDLIVTLSDASSGAGLTATTASGNVVAGASGADLGDLTSKKAKVVQTDASGVYILSITDTSKTGFYVTAAPAGAALSVSSQLVTGNYG
jgi:predicted RecA/RadA family phage recombinase